MRDHLIVFYLCNACKWNLLVICEPGEPPPKADCASCALDAVSSAAPPVEGILASADECRRVAELCQSPEPAKHREAMRFLETLRDRYVVAITEWASEPPSAGGLDVAEFKRRITQD